MAKESKMKIIRAICFILVTYFVLFAIGSILQSKNKENYASFRSNHMKDIFNERENSLDVLVVGHSGVLFGFSPMELYESYGVTSFNCARTSLSPNERYDMIEEVLKTQSPQVIILNMDGFFHDTPKGYFTYSSLHVLTKMLPIFNNHSKWRNYLGKNEENHPRSITKNHIVENSVAPYKGEENMRPTQKRRKFFTLYRQSLDKICNLCEEKGIQIVFTELPSVIYWNMERHNAAADYAESKGIPFIDFNLIKEEIGFDWAKHTIDKGDHLNDDGAELITNYLGNYLVTNYNLDNHRGDETYKSWEEDLLLYKEKYGE